MYMFIRLFLQTFLKTKYDLVSVKLKQFVYSGKKQSLMGVSLG